ncbi:helix-turn-helix transcriptional regulator [Amycolatopsis nigrescens]|uniref:helix-turn-helix transcriptional regulator n=1 Tax=Amycolatopsis nigrescens TaxID=381445 RepID=UPI0003828FA1|nr:helix-turn-helix transcriptional regulator [Amycolatopsis nigrescens]
MLRELPAAAGQGLSAEELGELVSRAIAPVVAHDGVRLDGTNPTLGTGPGAFGFWYGYEPSLSRALQHSYHAGDDPCLAEDLARRPVPVGVIGTGGGDRRRDKLTRRLLTDHGAGCELRLLLRDARGVWGMLGLLRAQGDRPFDAGDAHRVASLGPSLIAALRGYVTAGPLAPVIQALPAGVLLLGPDLEVSAVTPQALRWEEQLRGRENCPGWAREAFFVELALRTRIHARDPRTRPPVVYGPAVNYGRWMAFHGQVFDNDDGTGGVAIVIEAATGTRLLPAFCDWYAITTRERQIITELLDGAAAKRIARRLDLSLHTVNDHLKKIFRKTGASGRDELVAAITG